MPGPGPGQRRGPGQVVQRAGGHRVGRHDRVPLGPLGVADADRDGAAERHAVPHPAGDFRLVLLELHPRAPAVPGPAAGQRGGHVGGADLDARGQPFADRDERPPVRFPRGQPAQHDADPPTKRPGMITPRRPGPGRRPARPPRPGCRAAPGRPRRPARRWLARCAASSTCRSPVSRPGTGTRYKRQVGPVRPGQQPVSGDRRLGRQRLVGQRHHVRVLVRLRGGPALRQRGQPGAVHGERHRPGDVDDHRAGVPGTGPPHLGRGHRHRPRFWPPPGQRGRAGERGQRGPAVAADHRRQGHLTGLLPAQPARARLVLRGQQRDHGNQQPGRVQRRQRPRARCPGPPRTRPVPPIPAGRPSRRRRGNAVRPEFAPSRLHPNGLVRIGWPGRPRVARQSRPAGPGGPGRPTRTLGLVFPRCRYSYGQAG